MPGDDQVGDEPSDEHVDAVDGVVFDEDFVKGASVVELGAEERAKHAKRDRRRSRGHPVRRAGQRIARWARRNTPLLVAAAIVVVVVGLAVRGQGPLGQVAFFRRLGGADASSASPSATTSSTITPSTSSSTTPEQATSTTIDLLGMDYDAGSCITWDQSAGLGEDRLTNEVDCAEPHLFEVTTSFEIDGSAYGEDGPTDAQWGVVSRSECLTRATEFLGYPLDPEGRYHPNLIKPQPPGWRIGDRTVWCGMVISRAGSAGPDDQYDPFSGKVEGADQTMLYGVGTCFGPGTPDRGGPVVACTEPHVEEVVGTADLGSPGAAYPGTDAIGTLSGDQCQAAAEKVYGGAFRSNVTYGWLGLSESSWNVGRRIVECTLGLRDGNGGWAVSPTLVRR